MMWRISLFVLGTLAAFADDNPWGKVRDLKSGTELRIYKKGGTTPILALMDDATDDRLMVVVKNEQLTIAKDDINRIDFRPQRSSRVLKDTKTTTDNAGQTSVGPVPKGTNTGPGTTTTTSLSVGSKPDFETIYRRTASAK